MTISMEIGWKRVSAAKCHDHDEIFTNENSEHIRGSLVLIADTQ